MPSNAQSAKAYSDKAKIASVGYAFPQRTKSRPEKIDKLGQLLASISHGHAAFPAATALTN